MENKATKITLTITIILLLGLGVYILNDKVIKPHYQQQGVEVGAYTIINQINSQGSIPVITNNNTVQWISVQEICSGGQR